MSVAGYNIYRNGVQVATVNTPSYSDNSLSSNTSYSYVISAFDAAGNTSGQSNTLSVDTPATSNLAPTVSLSSSQLTITTGSSVTLTWSTIGAVSCTASDGWSGVKAISGSASFSPTQTTNYILTCYNASGLSSVKSITVNVSSQPSSGINGGLIGYWPFDKIIGNATNDYSGNNNLGVLANSPVASSGKIGGAIHFNGTNSDIVTPATIRSEAGSISVWVKPEATMGSQRAYPVFITTADGNSLKLYFDGYNGKNNSWTFELRGTFGNFISITSPVNSNAELQQWQHIIVTWDVNKGANMYINGALKASSNMKTGLIVSPGLTIGSDIKTFLGYMDEFRLYDRVLSSKDITDVYTSTQLAIAPTGPDISRPTTPANFTGNPSSQTTIDLFWKAAADNVGVSGYKIFRDGVQIGTTVNNSYTDKNLNPNTIYKYSVVAYDAAGNISSNSNVSSVPTSPPALALLSGNNGTIPGPGPQPVIPETALHISESPYMGTTWAMILFDLAPWIHPGGDWRDKNFVLQGTSPWATGVIRNSGTEQKVAFNVTSLIINQKGSTAQKIANRGWLLTPGGGTTIATLYSKESNIASNRPVLHVITTTGTYDLAPE